MSIHYIMLGAENGVGSFLSFLRGKGGKQATKKRLCFFVRFREKTDPTPPFAEKHSIYFCLAARPASEGKGVFSAAYN